MSVKVSFGQNALKKTNKAPAFSKPAVKTGSSVKNNPFAKNAAPKTEVEPPKAPVKKEEAPLKKEEPPKPAGKAPNFVEKLQDCKTTVGKTAIIDCVCEGDPEPDTDWFHDGKLIKDEGRFRYLYEKDDVIGLEIRKVEASDEGEYKCVAFNKSGKAECKCNIYVDAAGKIIVGPRDSTYEENQTAVFKCKYHGNPHPEMKWFLGKKQIKSGNKYFISNKNNISSLEIDELTSEDGGYYSVVVSNEAGEDEVTFHLKVNPNKKSAPEPAKPEPKPASTAKFPNPTSTAPKKATKKNAIPIQRENIKIENPERFYEFDDEIGRGKFAVVKKCKSKTTGKEYAAKIIKFEEDTAKFAIREYDLMVDPKFQHPGLVKLHEAYLVRKYLILIMELCDGKTFLDFISSKHSLTEDDVANYIRQMCEILNHIHSSNIVHLDLRPTNIRFKNGRELQILDYNSARAVLNKKAGTVVDSLGDTEFCAPEMLNFDPVSPPSDMWTVAVNMFILLCGTSPFYNENEDLVILNVQKVKYDKSLISHATSEAQDFIFKCLIRAPEMRLTAQGALKHKFLSNDYANIRKNSKITCQDVMRETDERLYSEEEEEYGYPSLVFRTFDEEEYESPEESSEEED